MTSIRYWFGRNAAWVAVLAGFAALAPLSAKASLGSDVASIRADQVRMRGNTRMSQGNGYAVHEIQTSAGATVREYVSAEGKVFGVAWQGPARPDLRQVLGNYFDTYLQGMQRRTARGVRRIEANGLVVEFGGHQRSFFGRAYVPQIMPANVRAESIK